MDCFRLIGGHPLKGTISINGAKNAALPLMVASLLTDESLVLKGVPWVGDVLSMSHLLEDLGAQTQIHQKTLTLRVEDLSKFKAEYDIVRKMRASILVLGALLGRCGQAEVSLPGGCAIGPRPVDLHLEGLRALGVSVDLQNGYIVAHAPGGRVPGGEYTFPKVSVTGTQNIIFAAVYT